MTPGSQGIVSIDTETLGHYYNNPILSIGISFHPWESPDIEKMRETGLYIKLDVADQIKNHGCKILESTAQWWREQSEEAKIVLKPSHEDVKIDEVPGIILDWVQKHDLKWKKMDTYDRKCYDVNRLQYIYDIITNDRYAKPWNAANQYEFATALCYLGYDRYGGITDFDGMGLVYHNALDDSIMDSYRLLKCLEENGVFEK